MNEEQPSKYRSSIEWVNLEVIWVWMKNNQQSTDHQYKKVNQEVKFFWMKNNHQSIDHQLSEMNYEAA
jgi:hypothetical protein